jgi:ribosomal protein L22
MTERNNNPNQKTKNKGIVETPKENKNLFQKNEEKKEEDKTPLVEEKVSEKKEEKKKPIVKKAMKKKNYAIMNSYNLPISTKHSMALCKFVKWKTISKAVEDLQKVLEHKKAIPMKGEIPHRKGKGMMSGRYADKSTKQFIILVKSLGANAVANEMDEPIIVEGVANMASRPYTRFGRGRKKRTHIKLTAGEKKIYKKIKGKKKK